MRLVYKGTQQLVEVGDQILRDGETFTVGYFAPPHKPSSSGKVTVLLHGSYGRGATAEYYVGVIGAEWIEREDRE